MQKSIPTLRPASSGGPAAHGRGFAVRFFADGRVVEAALPIGAALVVGRSEDADLPVADEAMSRRHALLVAEVDGSLAIEDFESANGTSVDGRTLAPGTRTSFAPGAVLRLGNTLGAVHRGGVGARPQRAADTADLARALGDALAAAGGDATSLGLCAFEGAGVEQLIALLDVLVPPDGHVARVDARRVVCLFGGSSRSSTDAWARVVVAFLASRRVHVAFRTASETSAEISPERILSLLVDREGAAPGVPAKAAPVSQGMRRVFELVHRVAPTSTSVLILGETGAGKEVIARTIHSRSERPDGPFVALNCAALPEALLEGELFGYEKGAFTGATQAKPGLVETASGGTLFLDELGEMPLATQSKLLRVLEDGAVLRLGSVKARPVAFRLLAATNRDIQEEIQGKRFRADLYYRLNGLTIAVPPLRERKDEIDALVDLFARHAAKRLERRVPVLSEDVRNALRAHRWPGNVRELRNVVERLVLLAGDGRADLEHLPEEVLAPPPPTSSRRVPGARASMSSVVDVEEAADDDAFGPEPDTATRGALTDDLARIERTRILEALEQCAGNQTRAAKQLGISRRVLIKRIERYGVARPRK